jgi:hypothetical protein
MSGRNIGSYYKALDGRRESRLLPLAHIPKPHALLPASSQPSLPRNLPNGVYYDSSTESRNRDTLECAWCSTHGRPARGHTIADCRDPDHFGQVPGRGRCNNWTHILQYCQARKSLKRDSLLYWLVIRRDCLPPFYHDFPIEDIPGFHDTHFRPWTVRFALANPDLYGGWPHGQTGSLKVLELKSMIADPA